MNEMLERKCYRCKKQLCFVDLLQSNTAIKSQYLQILWNDERIQFYCCQCYAKLTKRPNNFHAYLMIKEIDIPLKYKEIDTLAFKPLDKFMKIDRERGV